MSSHFWRYREQLCSDEFALDLANELDLVVAGAAQDYEYVARGAELHGYDLFHGRADWQALAKMSRARISIYGQVLAALGRLPVHIIIRGVDRRRLACRHPALVNPHSIVLSHLLERVDEHAKKLGQRALVIADELGQEDQRQYREDLNIYRQTGTNGYRGHRLTQIVDTLHFAPSKASRLVQAVDMVAFLARRILCKEDNDPRAVAANGELWVHVEHRVVHCWCWRP